MKKTKQQIASLVIDILCAALCVVLLFVAITVLTSSGKGYTPFFGRITMGVETASMWPYDENGNVIEGAHVYTKGNAQGYLPSFNKGDLIVADELDEKEKLEIKVGDIVVYKSVASDNTIVLVTHRVVSVDGIANGIIKTLGDAETNNTGKNIQLSTVVGKIISVKEGAGGFALFVKTSAGFFVCVVLPSILIVGYFLVMLIVALSKRDKVDVEQQKQELEAKLKAELEAKLRKEMGLDAPQPQAAPQNESQKGSQGQDKKE